MTKYTYHLADVDGVLCVACKGSNYNEPQYDIQHWPTTIKTFDFCLFFECGVEDLRNRFTIAQEMPGNYVITHVNGEPITVHGACNHLQLVNGARTESMRLTHEKVKRPKVGKGTNLEWSGGRWHIYPPKGKHRVVDV